MNGENSSRIRRFAPPRLVTPADYESVVIDSSEPPADRATERHLEESVAAKKTYELQQKINATRGNMPRYSEVTDKGSIGHTARLQLEVEKQRRNSQK